MTNLDAALKDLAQLRESMLGYGDYDAVHSLDVVLTEIDRLRIALQFYADHEAYHVHGRGVDSWSDVAKDRGRIAYDALKGGQ